MKKRKGKQAKSDETFQETSEETLPAETTVSSEPGAPEAETTVQADGADGGATVATPVAEVGDDDVTSRWDLRASRGDALPDEATFADEPTLADGPQGESATDEVTLAETTVTDPGTAAADADGIADSGSDGLSDTGSEAAGDDAAEAAGAEDGQEPSEEASIDGPRLESILESILFASDRPLGLTDLKRLLGERDGKRLTAALEALREKRSESGIQLVSVAGGWQLRTHPANGAWVAKLVAGRPPRLSRAMMETLSIVAYRQPITRPEIDEIRGVDCGPVLHTLLDRGLIRVIGKKEEVGRPMLYGTTPEFLKTFSLRDLADLPTLREFHELGADDRARVDATAAEGSGASVVAVTDGQLGAPPMPLSATLGSAPAGELSDPDPEEEDALLEALDQATSAAARATASPSEPNPEPAGEAEAVAAANATPASTPEAGE